ncbi:DUF3352 domain-containing protein [Alkalinema sp. FACHB-956]|uniref:DUF3352 domain-containing protein n=1 Tax=Alkalinema sp. FACHB-956 TaxID=2692768 RepID=UPI001684A7E1|nr:DUF3352 domain-containing protein [Alkalinema sp. FACHB-956]MBD2328944.1 DUF3352 domain-containing protein [Alkalinema sp. FACHB-956]
MKRQSLFSALTLVVAIPLLVVLLGFGWMLSQGAFGGGGRGATSEPTAMIFIPKNAPAMVSLLGTPDRLATVRQALVPANLKKQARQEFEVFRDSLLGSSDAQYDQAIKPWLGNEITAAITNLDVDRDTETGNQVGYLLALTTKNTQRSREFLQLFWQQRAVSPQDLVLEQYQGTQIIYGKVKQTNQDVPLTLASAVVGDRFVLFANSPKVLRNAINNVQAPDLNLANSPDYQRAISHLPPQRIGLAYLNLPQFAAALGDRTILNQLDTLTGKESVTYQGMAIGLSANRQGLVADVALVPTQPSDRTEVATLSQPIAALQYLPTNSQFIAAGTQLQATWQGILAGTKGYAKLSDWIQKPIQSLESRWHLTLTNDILNWVKGEYAFALLPNKTAKAAQPDWILMVDRSDETALQQGIQHLNELAKQQGLTPGKIQLGQRTVDAWTQLASTPTIPADRGSSSTDLTLTERNLQVQVAGVHTAIDHYEVFAPSIEILDTVLQNNSSASTVTSRFKGLNTPNNGYLQVSWPTLQAQLEQDLPGFKLLELTAQPLLGNLQALKLSGYGQQEGITTGGLLLEFR